MPYDLHGLGAHEEIVNWHRALTVLDRVFMVGLLGLTEDADAEQTVTPRELLDVVEISTVAAKRDCFEKVPSRHYQRAVEALHRFYQVSLPMVRRSDGQVQIHSVRPLDSLGLVYNLASGKYCGDDFRLSECRVDLAENGARPIYAMVETDDCGNWVLGADGRPKLVCPSSYCYRWSRPIVEDLLHCRHGLLRISRRIFHVLRALVSSTGGRPPETAIRLMFLVVADIHGVGRGRNTLHKPAKLIFSTLGLSDPGDLSRARRHRKDGRWSANVRRTTAAIRSLKRFSVLAEESSELPEDGVDGVPMYYWTRLPEWGAPPSVEVLRPTPFIPQTSQIVTGKMIRRARKKVGLSLRQFAERFGGCSHTHWRRIEQEATRIRTGQPYLPPSDIRAAVNQFVRETL